MNGTLPCPGRGDLERLLLGRMPEAEAAVLEGHVEQCARCLETVRTLRVDDPLVKVVRAGAQEDAFSAEAVDDRLITLLCGLGEAAGLPSSPTLRRGESSTAPALDPPGEPDELGRFGPYGILRVLGTGGMGIVFAARQPRPRRVVALKMILAGPSARGTDVARFHAETEVVARLRHPNIVAIHEVGEQDGRPYFTMEYVEGGSLAQKLAAAPLAHGAAAQLVETLARAVQFAHDRGVIHRDLKPANILLVAGSGWRVAGEEPDDSSAAATRHPPPGTLFPKITDFGLAKELSGDADGRTETGAILGTPGYMAPEQALAGSARTVGKAADVYALGAILYECLTGRPPFKAASVLETLEQVRSRDPVPPRSLQPGVPRDLETICLKCLQKEPAGRYASAQELADDLGRFLRGEPVRARPTPPLVRLAKWARRRPTLAALVAVSTLLLSTLVVGGGVYQALLWRALQQADANAVEMRRQHELADARYKAASDALKRMTGRVQTRRMTEIPQLTELQNELLDDALAFYQGVFAGEDDPDPAIRFDTAVAYQQAAGILAVLGKSEEKVAKFRRAVELLESLPPEHRDTPQALDVLAGCCNGLGISARGAGNLDEAVRHHRKAVVASERAAALRPDDATPRHRLAESEHGLGEVYFYLKRTDDAEACYKRAAAVRNELLRERPSDEELQASIAEDYSNLALLYQTNQRQAEATPVYEKAEALLRPLVARPSPRSGHMQSLAMLHVNRHYLLARRGDSKAALDRLDEAVRLLEAVLAREPRDAGARHYGYHAHGARAQMLEDLERFADAVKDWDRVVELETGPKPWLNRVLRAVALAHAGEHVRATAEAKRLLTDPAVIPAGRYGLACAYALSVGPARAAPGLTPAERERLAEQYAAAAVAILETLQTEGAFKDPKLLQGLKRDAELNSLRERSDFRRLRAVQDGETKP